MSLDDANNRFQRNKYWFDAMKEEPAWAHVRIYVATRAQTPHLLEDHLIQVAKRAGRDAAEYGKEWAYLAGLWHDMAKFRSGFRRYIRQANGIEAHIEGRVTDRGKTHYAAGAVWAERLLTERFGPRGRMMSRVLQYVIAGHHAGLDDRLSVSVELDRDQRGITL